jgi:hypothetical protein
LILTILEEIQDKIAQLSGNGFFKLVRWLRERHHDQWDRQIEEDAAAGRLDFLILEVNEAIAAGRTTSLDEICRNSVS